MNDLIVIVVQDFLTQQFCFVVSEKRITFFKYPGEPEDFRYFLTGQLLVKMPLQPLYGNIIWIKCSLHCFITGKKILTQLKCIQRNEKEKVLSKKKYLLMQLDWMASVSSLVFLSGMADPAALPQAVAAFQACHFIGMPECEVGLPDQSVMLLSLQLKQPNFQSVLQ